MDSSDVISEQEPETPCCAEADADADAPCCAEAEAEHRSSDDEARVSRFEDEQSLRAFKDQPPIADFGSRLAAFCFDAVILTLGLALALSLFSRGARAAGAFSEAPCLDNVAQQCQFAPTALKWFASLLIVAVTLCYNAFYDGIYGATLGKRFLNIELRDISAAKDRALRPIGTSRALLRSTVKSLPLLLIFFFFNNLGYTESIPSAVVLLCFVIAGALALSGSVRLDGRTVHDLVASSIVIDPRLIEHQAFTAERQGRTQTRSRSRSARSNSEKPKKSKRAKSKKS